MSQHHLDLRSKLIIMLSVMASLFLVALDQTIVATALGKIVEDLNAYSSLGWVVTAYLLTSTVTVPLAGKLSDLLGRRIMLLVGVAIFGITSLLCGMSQDITSLVIWRGAQGVGGGIITANAFTIIGDLFVSRERGRWQGLLGAVFGISSVAGPLLGGWLTDGQSIFGLTTSWHWIFWINTPVAVLAFIMILAFCPPLKHAKKFTIDYLGASLMASLLVVIVLAVDNTEQIFAGLLESTGLSLMNLRMVMLAITVILTVLFILSQRRAKDPVMPLKFFANKNFSMLMGLSTLFGAGFIGSIIYLTQFNQQVFGASATESGLMLLPMVAGIMIASVGSGQLITKIGRYKIFMVAGMILTTVMIGMMMTLTPESPYLYEAVLMSLLGLGLGLVMPVMTIAIQNEFSQKSLGVATSAIQLFRGLGSTIGIAFFGAILTAGLTANLVDVGQSQYINLLKQNESAIKNFGSLENPDTLLTLNMPAVRQKIRDVTIQSLDNTGLPESVKNQQKEQFIGAQDEYSNIVTHAFSESLRNIFLASALLMIPATILAFMIRERELKTATTNMTPGEA